MNLNYYNRRGKDLQDIIDTIKRLSDVLTDAKAVDEIMGIYKVRMLQTVERYLGDRRIQTF